MQVTAGRVHDSGSESEIIYENLECTLCLDFSWVKLFPLVTSITTIVHRVKLT